MNPQSDENINKHLGFKSNYLDINGIKYHYVDENPSGSDKVVLLIHGNPTWSFYFKDMIAALRETHRVIAVDHIGCGLSDKPQDYDYTLSNHIKNVEHLAKKLKLKNITLGLHDWGGAIGMGFAVENPDLIDRFIILNTAAFLINRLPLRIRIFRNPLIGAIGIRLFNLFSYSAIFMACKKHIRMTDALKDGLLAPYDSYKNRIANLEFVRDIPLTKDDKCYKLVESIERKLHNFRDKKMLILWGEKDFVFTNLFRDRWKQYFPKAKVHSFPDAGHYVLVDAGEKIIPLIKKFLAK